MSTALPGAGGQRARRAAGQQRRRPPQDHHPRRHPGPQNGPEHPLDVHHVRQFPFIEGRTPLQFQVCQQLYPGVRRQVLHADLRQPNALFGGQAIGVMGKIRFPVFPPHQPRRGDDAQRYRQNHHR